jgi:hypothetical protein
MEGRRTKVEPTKKAEEKTVPVAPEQDGALSANELDKVAGGRDNDPCEGGQFHSR